MVEVDLKIALVGFQAVGKTTLVQRFVNGIFDETVPYQITIAYQYKNKILEIDGKRLNVGMWDSGGEQRYLNISPKLKKNYKKPFRWEKLIQGCYESANAVIVCYNPTDIESFKRAKYMLRELRHVPEECKLYICATKSDLLGPGTSALPDLQIVENYAKMMKAKFFLTSSKTGTNVDKLFEEVARDYLSSPQHVEKLDKVEQMKLEEPFDYYNSKNRAAKSSRFNCLTWIWVSLKRKMGMT